MKSKHSNRSPFARRLAAAMAVSTAGGALALALAAPAHAQTTTSTVRGQVTTAEGVPVADAQVTATNVETGSVRSATTDRNGVYVLASVSPGNYRFSAASPEAGTATKQARLLVGQTASLDIVLGAVDAVGGSEIVVVGTLVETKTSEIGTNVTEEQIENLPQNNRNFLNFAALAPGIRVSGNETRRTFAGGGISADPNGEPLASPQVNVFIDGVSLKSNIQQGGLVGQDASRGNPFSQLAVQEFRVLTSNFKAEYEDAGTSIITAITKSGTNEFHGSAFFTYQDESLIERDFFQKRDDRPKPDLKRYQFGAALGGPIMQDDLFFFLSYEGNLQDRTANVLPGGDAARQAAFEQDSGFNLDNFAGTFASPFREHLGFGKLTWQIADNQLLEVTGSVRIETDLRDFGGETARERGTDIENNTYTARARHQYEGNGFINEATIDYLKADLTFGSAAGDQFGRNYFGVINFGGRPDFQDITQEGLTFRNNLSLTGIEWNGEHLIKAGVKFSRQKYRIGGSGPFANPLFNFNIDESQGLDFSFPFEVNFGAGDPNISANTTQIGLFIQDDWAINEHLTLNLGLRWDYDSNSKNNSFVTPPEAAAALRALGADPRIGDFYDVEDYISTGDRDAPLDQFQPRIGFSYDLNADQRTVFFGGFGRYYDRALFRNAAEESLFRQFRRGNLLFSRDGLPRQGRTTVQFQDSFLTPDGFAALLAGLAADPSSPGTSELRVIPNDLKSPHTDQYSLGVRQRLGQFRTSLSYSFIHGKDQIGYAPLNRTVATNAGGFLDFIPLINGFSNAVAAFNTRATKYHAVYLTVDKPYSESSGWGAGLAYTLAFSDERGFAFNFDFPNIGARPFVPNSGDERHRVVLNGIVDLPWEFKLSGLATIASGAPFFVIDASEGFGARDIRFPGNVGDIPMFAQVDLRLQKDFKLFGDSAITLSAEVFNLFDRANFGGAEGFIPPEGNANFGNPNSLSGPPRSFQFGAAFRF